MLLYRNEELERWRKTFEDSAWNENKQEKEIGPIYVDCHFQHGGDGAENEMRALRCMCGVTRKDKINNEYIRGAAAVANISGNVTEIRLKWLGNT